MRRIFQRIVRQPSKAVLFALVLGAAGLITGFHPGISNASSAGCDPDNDIINCGFSGKADFISTVRSNKSGSGHHDLPAIYSAYGLEPADYDRFVQSARAGLAYKDNTIRVDGKVVASNVDTIGRNASKQGSGYFKHVINGVTYYGNTNDKAFATGPLPVTVLFDGHGNVQFAVINSCGNPVGAPNYSCDMLHAAPVAGQPGTYNYYTDVTANSTAKVSKLVYDFGDGTTRTTTSPNLVVSHTYAQSKSYRVSVKVYISLPHAPDVVINSANCAKVITVALPYYQCLALDATTINGSKYQYRYVVKASFGNGATLQGADFNFGDKQMGSGTVSGTTVTTTHAYDKEGAFTVTATLRIKLPSGQIVAAGSPYCTKKVSVAIPFYNCVQLGGDLLDQDSHKYRFTATATFGNGASFTTADFDFGDGTSQKGVKAQDTTASVEHSYQAAGNYTATATLYFNAGSKVQSVNCIAGVSPTQAPTPECKPGVPQGSALCSPCTSNPTLPANSPDCVQALPNTGAGDIIGVAGVVAVLGFFFYRQFLSKRSVASLSGALAGHHVAHPAEPADDTLVQQVVTHHRNDQPLNHPGYHRPHRFRPRSQHEHDDEA